MKRRDADRKMREMIDKLTRLPPEYINLSGGSLVDLSGNGEKKDYTEKVRDGNTIYKIFRDNHVEVFNYDSNKWENVPKKKIKELDLL